jgi:hypothetical protein
MRLTIIVEDGAVYKDGINFLELVWNGTPFDVHALQWQDVAGWIEYIGDKPNETITELPQWAYNALDAWQIAYDKSIVPPIPLPPTAEENKINAISLLQQTDWTQIPSVSDPALSNPYLANKLAFDQYRNSIRQYAIYPVAGDLDWATIPQEVWQTV